MNKVFGSLGNLRGAIRGASALTMATAMVFAAVAAPAVTRAGSATAPLGKASDPITIPAGGTATLNVRGFCLDYGKPFPTGDTAPTGLAAANVQGALNYSIDKGYTDNNAAQVELAVWYLRDNTWHVNEHTLGTEIATSGPSYQIPPAPAGATSVADALAQNKVTITAKFVPQTSQNFYGDGQAQIKNTTSADLTVYMPVGVVFAVPTSSGNFQTLAAYALSNQPSQAGTPTAGATTSPAVTASAVVTGTASPAVTAVSTVSGTATSVLTGTATVTTPTEIATVAATTPTTEATAVATTAATTVVETATTEAVATSTPEATATTSAGAGSTGTLPQTGSGNSSNPALLAGLLTALALIVLGSIAGLASKKRM